MRSRSFLLAVVVALATAASIYAEGIAKEELARQAVSENSANAAAAVRALRAMGPEGLDAIFQQYDAETRRFSASGDAIETWKRISFAIDNVAMQKDAYSSRLYWYTDLEEAKRAATAQNRPILSLRLLGNLNEEFSCANSRFFRATLYANTEISKFLRENYILHWKSVRPAPRVTIDFGDGRKIERTLTGNSIHYVLNGSGVVIDALPGLYSPEKFAAFIRMAQAQSKMPPSTAITGSERQPEYRIDLLQNYRAREYRTLYGQINTVGNQVGLKFDTTRKAARSFEEMPPAMVAAAFAMAKSMAEIRVLKNITPDLTQYGGEQIDLDKWKKIAGLTKNEAKLDAASIAFIRKQTGKNSLTPKEFDKLIRNLESYMSVDTARNEFLMRPTLLVWLNKGMDKDLDTLNEKVYAELFLTPNEDKWLGLYSTDIYTALDGNGIIR
jgi:hypothetical protein